VLSRDTLNKWIKRHAQTGCYAPMKVEKDHSIKPWHALAIALCKRPQGSTKRWVYEQLVAQLGEHAPSSYDRMCDWFREDFSAMDQLKGRYTGSQLRVHKFYQHRTSAGLAPADEIHADGWNTHFTAPHQKTGEFVTYEVWHFHDVATRYVTQPGIHLTENADVIAKGLENCVRELGVMVHLQTDSTGVVKGNDKFTKALHSMEERLGFTWVHPKEVGNSQANGIAENFNTSWLDKRSRELATYQNKSSMDSLTFKRVKKITADMVKADNAGDLILRDQKKREAERMGKGLVFTSYEEAVTWIRRIFNEYNDRPHRALKQIADPTTGKKRHQTPREALNEHIANGWEMTKLEEFELIDAFRPHVICKVTRETVTPYGGNRYRNPEVLGHWNGKEVVVAYDMDDFSRVIIKDLKGALICEAEFVGATGYRGQTAREAGDEKRTLATLKRIEKKRETVLRRNPGFVIEADTNVKTIADFIDLTPSVPKARELTMADFMDAPKEVEKEASYEATMLWLRGEGPDPRSKEVAAG
jgi:putative transposase